MTSHPWCNSDTARGFFETFHSLRSAPGSSKRLTATDRVRNEIDGLFTDPERDFGEVLEEDARPSVRLVMQSSLEAEATEFLGRER